MMSDSESDIPKKTEPEDPEVKEARSMVKHNLRFEEAIGQYVKVKTIDLEEHVGWLLCIDPLTGNLLLFTFADNLSSPDPEECKLIMGDAYSSLEVLEEADDKAKDFIKDYLERVDSENNVFLARRRRLQDYIRRNRIPIIIEVNEDDSIIVDGTVIIEPPYTIQDCSSDNEASLEFIQEIIAKLWAEENPEEAKAEFALKKSIIAFIKKCRLPVRQKNDRSIVVGGTVKVVPPFRCENCSSDNEASLEYVTELIAKYWAETNKKADEDLADEEQGAVGGEGLVDEKQGAGKSKVSADENPEVSEDESSTVDSQEASWNKSFSSDENSEDSWNDSWSDENQTQSDDESTTDENEEK